MKAERRAPYESRMSYNQIFEICAVIKLRRGAESLLYGDGWLSPQSIANACGLTRGMALKVMFDVERYRSKPYYNKIKPLDDMRKSVRKDLNRLGYKIVEFHLDIARESAQRLAKQYMGEYEALPKHRRAEIESGVKTMFNLAPEQKL